MLKQILSKRIAKRLGLAVVSIAAAGLGAIGIAGLTAKVINVTAQIEHALAVSVDPIDFGSVFPQQFLTHDLAINLSDSFLQDDSVQGARYTITQKPKVKEFANAADPHANPQPGDPEAIITPTGFTGPAWQYCEQFLPVNSPYSATSASLTNEYWQYCYLPLANYLSKHELSTDGDESENDSGIDAFHFAYIWEENQLPSDINPSAISSGKLSKTSNDTTDLWQIDLKVPCFNGHCAQDAFDVNNTMEDNTPGFYIPSEYRLPNVLVGKKFGTDLWVEVTEIMQTSLVFASTGEGSGSLGLTDPPATSQSWAVLGRYGNNASGGDLERAVQTSPFFAISSGDQTWVNGQTEHFIMSYDGAGNVTWTIGGNNLPPTAVPAPLATGRIVLIARAVANGSTVIDNVKFNSVPAGPVDGVTATGGSSANSNSFLLLENGNLGAAFTVEGDVTFNWTSSTSATHPGIQIRVEKP